MQWGGQGITDTNYFFVLTQPGFFSFFALCSNNGTQVVQGSGG